MSPLQYIRSIIICLTIISLVVSIEFVASLRNELRSVEKCDTVSPHMSPFQCRVHCENNYIFIDKQLKRANQDFFEAIVKVINNGEQATCCCRFETFWPEFVEPEAVGRVTPVSSQMAAISIDCLPLIVSFRISSKTVKNYNIMCKYLKKVKPMTMRELIQFVEAIAYLNYVKPKHPAILKTLALKEIERITMTVSMELQKVYGKLLQSFRKLEEFDGYRLDPIQMKLFQVIRREQLVESMRSDPIARAYDEYVVSYGLVDIVAASLHLEEINKFLEIPESLIKGEYDKYNKQAAGYYFQMENLDCKLLKKTQRQLTIYLTDIRSSLSSLKEKGFYEHMSEKFEPLKFLINCERVYKSLVDVNCQKRAPTTINKQTLNGQKYH